VETAGSRLAGRRSPGAPAVLLLFLVLLLAAPAAAEIVLFPAGSDQISSVGVLDITENRHGDLYFATDNGLSLYNGSDWRIIHQTYGTPGSGLLDDHVLAVEFDAGGNLWLGFPDGIQWLEGGRYVTMTDQQLLKSLDIHDLLSANRWMWVAAGTAGLHRYRDGAWEWFRPQGPEGLGCTYASSLAPEPSGGTLYVACREGIWATPNTYEQVSFTPLAGRELVNDPPLRVRSDPFGGIYVFNTSTVLHFTQPDQWRTVVTAQLLMPGVDISDLRVDPERTLWISTNNGIYAWRDGRVRDHLDTARGLGSNAVKRLYLDSQDRLWFVTPENVGYYTIPKRSAGGVSVIPVITYSVPPYVTPPPTPEETPQITPSVSFRVITLTPVPQSGGPLGGLLEAIQRFFSGLLKR
jgi:ligand-binding sensor domain-containing protein